MVLSKKHYFQCTHIFQCLIDSYLLQFSINYPSDDTLLHKALAQMAEALPVPYQVNQSIHLHKAVLD